MNFIEGNPPEIPGVYLVRVASPKMFCYEISYKTMYWNGICWVGRSLHHSDKITHYSFIKEPRPLNENEKYSDVLGRMQCVVQQEVLPELSTPIAQFK